MKRKMRTYEEVFAKDLKDKEFARLYLNQALEDEDPRMFLLALKDVYNAQGIAMTDLAKETNVSRENLYRILSKKGNPKLNNVVSLLHAAGFTLSVQPNKK